MINTYSFALEIEKIRTVYNTDYIDSIIKYCEDKNIEIELIATYINRDQVLKSKIRIEAENLNNLKKGDRLPL